MALQHLSPLGCLWDWHAGQRGGQGLLWLGGVASAVKAWALDLVVAGEGGETVPSEKGGQADICRDFILVRQYRHDKSHQGEAAKSCVYVLVYTMAYKDFTCSNITHSKY